MKQEIIDKIYESGYDKLIEQFEENGYEFNDYSDTQLILMDSVGRFYMCEYNTFEDIARFLDKFSKMFLKNNDKAILSGMKKVKSVEDFDSLLAEYMPYSEADRCYYFTLGWKKIRNKDVLYELYKECLTLNESNELYDKLMQPSLIKKVKKYNKKDTINNAELIGLLDADGYLTVYHGHVIEDLTNHNSWTIKKEVAEYFGNRNALFNKKKKYYVINGKVKLKDIITYITDRNEFEVVVPGECVNIIETERHEYKEDFKRPFKNE